MGPIAAAALGSSAVAMDGYPLSAAAGGSCCGGLTVPMRTLLKEVSEWDDDAIEAVDAFQVKCGETGGDRCGIK